MHSIIPERGPSAMDAIGGVVAVVAGIGWIMLVSSMEAPTFFILFGRLFVVLAIVPVFHSLHNATSENRFSTFDGTTDLQEKDPLNELVRK
jgi:CDP-diglyceride synthetase